jgi:hypothetical protein
MPGVPEWLNRDPFGRGDGSSVLFLDADAPREHPGDLGSAADLTALPERETARRGRQRTRRRSLRSVR